MVRRKVCRRVCRVCDRVRQTKITAIICKIRRTSLKTAASFFCSAFCVADRCSTSANAGWAFCFQELFGQQLEVLGIDFVGSNRCLDSRKLKNSLKLGDFFNRGRTGI
jgi:hypothetical protein